MATESVSKVVHVRNIYEDGHEELLNFARQFGAVTASCHLAKFNQSLVEMESVESASAIIAYSRTNPVFIRSKEVHFSFSRSQQINQQAVRGTTPQKILLCTIMNPLFNITVDVMHQIMSPYGAVQRVVIFTKNGVQALVEFDNVQSAQAAKQALEGKDIYSGSCTLRIEYSHAERLNVHQNTDKTRDFTNSSLPTGPAAPAGMGAGAGAAAAGMQGAGAANFYAAAAAQGAPGARGPAGAAGAAAAGASADQFAALPPQLLYSLDPAAIAQAQATLEFYRTLATNMGLDSASAASYAAAATAAAAAAAVSPQAPAVAQQGAAGQGASNAAAAAAAAAALAAQGQGVVGAGGMTVGPVVMVYGLADQFDCDRLFNLLCLYGNVQKIKMLTNKRGSAMVQMEDSAQAQAVLSNLHQVLVFGSQIQVQHSKHPYIADSSRSLVTSEGAILPPGSMNPTKDYSTSPYNRFRPSRRSDIYRPSQTLFFAALGELDETTVRGIFTAAGAEQPTSVQLIHSDREDRNPYRRMGLAEFKDLSTATEAIVLANNTKLGNSPHGSFLQLSYTGRMINHPSAAAAGAGAAPAAAAGAAQPAAGAVPAAGSPVAVPPAVAVASAPAQGQGTPVAAAAPAAAPAAQVVPKTEEVIEQTMGDATDL